MTAHDAAAPSTSPWWAARAVSRSLPDFPWDRLTEYAETARSHPDGIVDLSVGTPVDATPAVAQLALAAGADAPGYPVTVGLPATRQAALDWLERRFGVSGLGLDAVLPVIGSKELIGTLPAYLGLGPGDVVVHPELAYPTYEVGARLAGAETRATDEPASVDAERVRLVYVNSPSNPTGRVLPAQRLRELVAWCREHDALLVSDECYLECAWSDDPARRPVSALHPDVCDGDPTGILTVHSLSKRSNLAGYRCAFVAGDVDVVAELLAVRKNLGLMMPRPQQEAMAAALDDDGHVDEQHARYAARRSLLMAALARAGFRVDHSEASLYLWATRDEPCWDTVRTLAERGILVAPGEFYGSAGSRHVRVAFTATDERVATAAERLGSL